MANCGLCSDTWYDVVEILCPIELHLMHLLNDGIHSSHIKMVQISTYILLYVSINELSQYLYSHTHTVMKFARAAKTEVISQVLDTNNYLHIQPTIS